MADDAYIKVPRAWFREVHAGGRPEWNEKGRRRPFEALMDLYAAASFAPRPWVTSDGPISLRRGETPPMSISYLMRRWEWPRATLIRFLDRKSEDGTLQRGQVTRDGGTWILPRYDEWDVRQSSGNDLGTVGDTTHETGGDTAQTRFLQELTHAPDTGGDEAGGKLDGVGGGKERNAGIRKGKKETGGALPGRSDAVAEVWACWLSAWSALHPGRRPVPVLNTARRSKIAARLDDGFTVAQLCEAVLSAHRNPFFRGENDRNTYYGNVETIFRNDVKVRGHLEWGQANPASRPASQPEEFDDFDEMEA